MLIRSPPLLRPCQGTHHSSLDPAFPHMFDGFKPVFHLCGRGDLGVVTRRGVDFVVVESQPRIFELIT